MTTRSMTVEERARFIESQLRIFEKSGSQKGINKAVAFVEEQIREAEAQGWQSAIEASANVAKYYELKKADDVCLRCKFITFESWDSIAKQIRSLKMPKVF